MTTETISKSFRKYMRNITGKHKIKELQKTAMLGAAHILRKVQYSRFNMGTSITSAINSNYITAATLYSLGTWFFRNISVIPCIKMMMMIIIIIVVEK
jgi:hypothetical protein